MGAGMRESEKLSKQFQYVSLEEARDVLAGIGIELTMRQMKRAAELNPAGKRKLPFFVDPIEGKLKIEGLPPNQWVHVRFSLCLKV